MICQECLGHGSVEVERMVLCNRNGARFAEPDYEYAIIECEDCVISKAMGAAK